MSRWPRAKSIRLSQKGKGPKITLTPDIRALHTLLMGASGRGKSKLIEGMIRKDIHHGHGGCLLDPHGTLYNNLVRWLVRFPNYLERRKILLVEPTRPDWVVGFDPINFSGFGQAAGAARIVADGIFDFFGGEGDSRADKPLLSKVLPKVLEALADQGLSLLEAEYLISSDPALKPIRERLVAGLRDPRLRRSWEEYLRQEKTYRQFAFDPIDSRLDPFLSSEYIRDMLAQKDSARTLDFQKLMDEGWFVLVNLAPRGTDFLEEDAQLLGALMFKYMYMAAKEREPVRGYEFPRPWYLYVDECYRYITSDVANILEETRKFGLHANLACQHMGQLADRGDRIMQGVMAGCQTKILFGLEDYDQALFLGKQLNPEVDLQEYKDQLTKPTVVGYETIYLNSRSRSTSSPGDSVSVTYDADGNPTATVEGAADPSFVEVEGENEALKPILKERHTDPYSLPEQFHRNAVRIMGQPERIAIVKFPAMTTSHQFTARTIPDYNPSAKRIEAEKVKLWSSHPLPTPRVEVQRQIVDREKELRELTLVPMGSEEPERWGEPVKKKKG